MAPKNLKRGREENRNENDWSDDEQDYDDDQDYDDENEDEQGDEQEDDDYDESDGEDADNSDEDQRDMAMKSDVPMYKLLQQARKTQVSRPAPVNTDYDHTRTKRLKRERPQIDRSQPKEKRSKNAPAEMRSDRPVRRLRVNADNAVRKSADPRFLDYTGNMNHERFSKDYAFLDDRREKEIEVLSKKMKKTKNAGMKDEIRKELLQMKQHHMERKLNKKVMDRLESIKQEEREKVKQGKKRFFLKSSARKQILAEEKYADLKKRGKLQKFMEKKRHQAASKERMSIPGRREWD